MQMGVRIDIRLAMGPLICRRAGDFLAASRNPANKAIIDMLKLSSQSPANRARIGKLKSRAQEYVNGAKQISAVRGEVVLFGRLAPLRETNDRLLG